MDAKEYMVKVYPHKANFTRIEANVAMTNYFNCKRAILLIEADERERVRNSVRWTTLKELMDYDLIDKNKISKGMLDDIEYMIIEKF